MNKRQIIIIISAVAIIVCGKLLSNVLATPKERPPKKTGPAAISVYIETVKNDTIPIFVETTGLLQAKNRLELFSEVQGIMLTTQKPFKKGIEYNKGETLLKINAAEQEAQVTAQRSVYLGKLSAVMPDIRADYNEDYKTWSDYLNSLSANQPLAKLPKVESEKLRSFLIGRNILSDYYQLQNAEINLSKYTIRAPYKGILVEANVDPGTVVRQGQNLGVFIQPKVYELEANVDATSARKLKLNQEVELYLSDNPNKKWLGNISRLVNSIDAATQLTSFYVQAEASNLQDGMYLTAKVKANKVKNAYEVNRSLLVNENQLYVVKDSTLKLKEVKVEFQNKNTTVVSGLENGTQILTTVPPSAFDGMKIKVAQQ